MKFKLALIATLAILALPVMAQYQPPAYGTVTMITGGCITNTVITNTVTGAAVGDAAWINQVIDCRKTDNVSLAVTGVASVTEANVVTFSLAKSIDGSSYETAYTMALTCSATGGTSKTVVTNIGTAGVGYLKITGVSNAAAAGGLTNVTIKASQKLLNGK